LTLGVERRDDAALQEFAMWRTAWLVGFVGACAPDDTEPGVEARDVRVADPEPEAGVVDMLSPEQTIEPYSDVMLCLYLEPTTEDLVADELRAFQGDYGHHIVVLRSVEQKEPGTWEDCSEAADMPNFKPMILPDTPLPAGYAVKIPAGTQPVMQIHYVNPTDTPLLVRDVARLYTVPEASVTTWAATFATNHLGFEVAPGGDTKVEFDCTTDEPLEVLLLGGHMHEWGTRFEVQVGASVDALSSEYVVSPWVPDYRDAPPVSLFFEAPRVLPAGSIIRTTCEYASTESEGIAFPHEMCSTFGYVGGTAEPWVCEATW
jgi:hypothetical protein